MSDLPLIKGVVSDILTQQGQAAQFTAGSTASTDQATGAAAEATAYGEAGAVATQNAALEGVAGQVQQVQTARQVTQTIGQQQAGIAAAGFANSGSAIDLARSSVQQGHLADQIIQTQTKMTQGGFIEQAAAAGGEQAATNFASQAATTLAQQQAAAATTASTTSANETAALINYLNTSGTGGTPQAQLALSVLSGNPNMPAKFDPQQFIQSFSITGGGFTRNPLAQSGINPLASRMATGALPVNAGSLLTASAVQPLVA